MARDFSPIAFFQRTLNALLRHYFQDKRGVLSESASDGLAVVAIFLDVNIRNKGKLYGIQ